MGKTETSMNGLGGPLQSVSPKVILSCTFDGDPSTLRVLTTARVKLRRLQRPRQTINLLMIFRGDHRNTPSHRAQSIRNIGVTNALLTYFLRTGVNTTNLRV